MPAVTIFIDTYHLLDDQQATLVVKNVADYPRVYQALKVALSTYNATLTIYVRPRAVAVWLEKCASFYGEQYISLRTYTPRDALLQRWQLKSLPPITDREIMQARLLEEDITPKEEQDFWEVLLEHFYDGSFTYKTFPLGNLSILLNTFEQTHHWEKAAQLPLVVRAKNDKLAHWERTANSEAVRTIAQRLSKDPATLRHDLISYKLLRHYPAELGEKILAESWTTFHSVSNLNLDSLLFTKEDAKEARNEIEYYLAAQSTLVSSTDNMFDLLAKLSGYLYSEFDCIEELARKHSVYLTFPLLQLIEQRFHPLERDIEASLAQLRLLVRPLKPQKPDIAWDITQWLEWITHSYMPYYTWLDAQAQREADVAEYAFLFADWFHKHFVALKNGAPQYFAYNALYSERDRILKEYAVTLIVIVDNLNYAYFDELRRQFQRQKFALEEVCPLLSLIPTATSIGKAALIVGQGEHVDALRKSYSRLVQQTWAPLLDKKTVTYLSNIGELQAEHTLAHDVYFLNYLPIDEALHEDNRDSGRSHSDVIRDYFTALAKDIARFARRFQIEHRLTVYVLSDHGSTRIPQESINVIDQGFFKKLSIEKHHRFIKLSEEKFAALPQMATTQCYLIDRHTFKTNHNYLIAQQYYRFLKTAENFYVHGGLTPEEVVVPFARFTCVPVIPEPPTLLLLDKEFRYAVKSKIALELGNPNAFPLESLSIRLVDADADEVSIAVIGPKQKIKSELLTTFRKVPGSVKTRSLTLRVHYECQGRIFDSPDRTFEITMKALMEVDDDDFNF